jgi:hypothetical protein
MLFCDDVHALEVLRVDRLLNHTPLPKVLNVSGEKI